MLHALIKNVFFIFIGIFGIGFLIGFHELGHFFFCKLFKISTPSFSIGMGPKIIQKKIGDTNFSISALPIGGYVEIAGMAEVAQGDQKEAGRRDQYSFAVKPYYQKLLVLFGGILFNLIFAYVTFIFLFMAGIPKSPLLFPDAKPIIGDIVSGSAAEKYNLKANDRIIAINDQPIKIITEVSKEIRNFPNKQLSLTIERDGKEMKLDVVPTSKMENDKEIGILGINYQMEQLAPLSFFESIKRGIQATNSCIYLTVQSLSSIFKKRNIDNIGGPILIISETITGIKKGVKIFLIMLAFISVSLAILNLIPLPIMDGGQILFTTIEAIIRRQLPDKIKIIIAYATWIAVLLLTIYISIADIKRIFFKK